MKFSERKGLTKTKSDIQIESMDEELQNCLCNILQTHYWDRENDGVYAKPSPQMNTLLWGICNDLLKIPFDSLPAHWWEIRNSLRKHYFEWFEWYEIYDFCEFIVNTYPVSRINQQFVDDCNLVLERELSAYRFVGNQISQITSKEEISEIEEGLKTPFDTVNVHIQTALGLLSDRKSPDYRNSIKESISAVEAVCQIIAKDDDATLTKALNAIEKKLPINPNLKEALRKLYRYTSSSEGIRHAIGLLEEPNLNFEDAKFMLVSCSAFTNYLIAKASRAGII